MKKFYLSLHFLFIYSSMQAQAFSMNDLVSLTDYPNNKFNNYVSKKGYRSTGWSSDSIAFTYFDKKAKEMQPDKLLLKCDKEDKAVVAYQTTEKSEFENLCEQLKRDGYFASENNGVPKLYQKGNMTITTEERPETEKTVYSFIVEKKNLPRARDLQFAEDLLQLSSHEYLAAVFGEANVKKDLFYFTEKEVNKCSVLFPNTAMQIIFIWKDEAANKDISFIIIGGQVRAQSGMADTRQIELNTWQSKQGIRSGMSLGELQTLHGKNISFYGWETERPGVVTEKNTGGAINFKKMGVVLNCLDCSEDRYYTKNGIINSTDLLAKGKRAYVSTIILLPGKR